MTEIERIGDQLRRAFEGPAWAGASVTEALADVAAEQAFARPIPGAHSIAELALHITTWETAVRRTIDGEGEITVTEEENWPPVTNTTEAGWKAIVQAMVKSHLVLRSAITDYDMRRLDEVPSGAKSTAYVLLHGVIQHDVYHAAQIMLLKKGVGFA